MVTDLTQKKCTPCEGGTEPFTQEEIAKYHSLLKKEWEVLDGEKIKRTFVFKKFKEAIGFINQVADIAEEEQHHPDMHIYYNKVTIELWTHAIGGLSINDFIVASKIESHSKDYSK